MIRASLRRLWLEIRRNEYRWLFLVVAVGVGLALTERVNRPVVFWTSVSLGWRDALFVLGPWTGAAAAWSAGRERRHGLEDLLSTTARSPFKRRLWGWAAVSVLGLAAYALVGVWLMLAAAERISGDGPVWRVILVGALGLTTFSATGYAWGAWKPRRATAFVAMLVFSLLQVILADGDGAGSFLSAVPAVQDSAWLGITPDLSGQQTLLFLALTGLSLALMARISARGWFVRASIAGSAVALALAVLGIVGQDDSIRASSATFAAENDPGAPAPGSYEALCTPAAVTVCLQPAFEPMLGEASEQITALHAATSSLPGWPERVELLPDASDDAIPGVLAYPLRSRTPGDDLRRAVHDLARSVLLPDGAHPSIATNSLLVWALTAAGRPVSCDGEQATDSGAAIAPVDCAAVARMTAMDPAVVQTWLGAHAGAIADGSLSVEDLP